MAEFIRAASLSGYLDAMAPFAADPRALLREQGIALDALALPENLVSARAAFRLLERSAEVTGCATLGLRMAETRSIANLGATSLLIAHQPSLRHALAAITEFRTRINATLVLQVEERGDEAVIHEDFAMRWPEPARQSTDLALGVLMRLCGAVLGPNWAPLAVGFRHAPPAPADRAIFARIFRSQVLFDCEFDGLVVARADLDRPNPRADAELAAHARKLLSAIMAPAARSTVADVDQLVHLLLPTGRASIQTCAMSLGVPVRTLQRMLAAEGDTFSTVLDRARMQLATQYLANPRMRITEIAGLLGYGSTGAFSRWHAATFGRPARAARASRNG